MNPLDVAAATRHLHRDLNHPPTGVRRQGRRPSDALRSRLAAAARAGAAGLSALAARIDADRSWQPVEIRPA